LLRSAVERGRGKGLGPVRPFFAAPLEAARLVQQPDFERWKASQQGLSPARPAWRCCGGGPTG
jgi:hypothetical protein